MIQRIQTLLMVLAIGCLVATFFVPHWYKLDTATGAMYQVFSGRVAFAAPAPEPDSGLLYVNGALFGLAILLLSYSIFQYQQRMLQLKIGVGVSILVAVGIGLLLYVESNLSKAFLPQLYGANGAGFYLSVTAMLFNMGANRYIRADENLVKSMDRIR